MAGDASESRWSCRSETRSMGFFRSMDFTRQQYFRVGSPRHSASNSRDLAMDTAVGEPSSYDSFDTICGLVFFLAVLVLAVGAGLLLGAVVTNADQTSSTAIGKLESKVLAASIVSYGVTCFTSGIPLLIFSYSGWIFLDLARNTRLQVQKSDEFLAHLAELNSRHEERLIREQEVAQRRVEAERKRQAALARQKTESERLTRERLAEEERQEALAAEELTDEICADIDNLFARLADLDQRFQINLTKEIGDQFAQHQSFKDMNINIVPVIPGLIAEQPSDIGVATPDQIRDCDSSWTAV